MEEEYLQTIEKHTSGSQGKRGVDLIARTFATLVDLMSQTNEDILGDIFQGSITYGERGQFMTPMPIARMMSQMSLPTEPTDLEGRRSVCDCACGSGRMLMAAAEIQPNWHFVGQDVDSRCVKMASINMALRNCYSHIVLGNSLLNEAKLIYETGRIQVWGNAIRKVNRVPLPDREPETIDMPIPDEPTPPTSSTADTPPPTGPRKQLELF